MNSRTPDRHGRSRLATFAPYAVMKLYVVSDLHIEFEAFRPPAVAVDLVVLAGDIHVKDRGLAWARATFPDQPVLYVLGNREYYGKAYPKPLHDLKEKTRGTHIRVLENESFGMGDVKFLGCTLWTDLRRIGSARLTHQIWMILFKNRGSDYGFTDTGTAITPSAILKSFATPEGIPRKPIRRSGPISRWRFSARWRDREKITCARPVDFPVVQNR